MSTNEKPSTASDSLNDADVDQLGAEIVAAAARLSAATCAWLLKVAVFDAANGHLRACMASTAHWLAFSCGLARRTATDHVRVARALAAFPKLADEMSAGRLSYSQVRAIARVAHGGEEQLVDDLIEIAQHGTVAHLEAIVRGLRTVDDNEHPSQQADRERVTHRWNDESMWQLSARLDPERGALFTTALETIAREEDLSAADALVRLAEIGLAALADAKGAPRRLRGHEKAAVVIHLDPNAIRACDLERPPADASPPPANTVPTAGGAVSAAGALSSSTAGSAEPMPPRRPYARIAGGPGLPDRVVRRLLCAGRIRTIVRDGTSMLDVGRTHRLVTERQFRALMVRHQSHCGAPGCTNRILEIHHAIHWIDGGPTDLWNLIPLCEQHHLGHHNGEFTIEPQGDGAFTFLRADGQPFAPPPPNADLSDSMARLDHEFAGLSATAATTMWDGQRLDRPYAVSVLAIRREQARELAKTG